MRQALHLLQDKGLAEPATDGRESPKYEHRVRDRLQLRRDETAVVCLLLLRGPQTPGELRTRSERLFSFDGSEAVLATLQRLAGRGEESPEGALTVLLERQPGSREARWAVTLVEQGTGVREQGSEVRAYSWREWAGGGSGGASAGSGAAAGEDGQVGGLRLVGEGRCLRAWIGELFGLEGCDALDVERLREKGWGRLVFRSLERRAL